MPNTKVYGNGVELGEQTGDTLGKRGEFYLSFVNKTEIKKKARATELKGVGDLTLSGCSSSNKFNKRSILGCLFGQFRHHRCARQTNLNLLQPHQGDFTVHSETSSSKPNHLAAGFVFYDTGRTAVAIKQRRCV
jgi:hypothetical protein